MKHVILFSLALLGGSAFGQDAPPPPGMRPEQPRMAGHMRLVHKLVLEKYDVNKDGKLDDTEKATLKADAEKAGEQAKATRQARVLEKYDTNKDGTLDDSEKEAIKKDREALRGDREGKGPGPRGERGDRDGKGPGPRGERGDRGPRGERGDRDGADGPRGDKRPGPDRPAMAGMPAGPGMMALGHQLMLEKFDTNKNGQLDESEHQAIKAELDAMKKDREANCEDGKCDEKPADPNTEM